MCLTIRIDKKEFKNKPTKRTILSRAIKIADKPIICYKIFYKKGSRYKSPYQDYVWRVKGEKVNNFSYEGPYSGPSRSIVDLEVNQGLHAYITESAAIYRQIYHNGSIIKEMIIPKGTKYIVGVSGDIVALHMKFKRNVK